VLSLERSDSLINFMLNTQKVRRGSKRSSLVGILQKGALATVGLASVGVLGSQAKAFDLIDSFSCTINVAGSPDACDLTPGSVLATLGDKKVTFQGFTINTTTTKSIDVTYGWFDEDGVADPNFGDDFWSFEVKARTPASGPFELTYTYDVEIVDGVFPVGTSDPWYFEGVRLESNVVTETDPATRITKLIAPPGEELISLDGVPSGPRDYIFENNFKKITITDSVSAPTGSLVTSLTNAWTQKPVTQTPGPLPILGAGAAFGMSRRIRRRILSQQSN
jgi:hypothetical protein